MLSLFMILSHKMNQYHMSYMYAIKLAYLDQKNGLFNMIKLIEIYNYVIKLNQLENRISIIMMFKLQHILI